MLVAEGNLQVKHLLSVTLEPEMAGFDNTRMDGTNGDLMNFMPFDLEVVADADDRVSGVGCRVSGVGERVSLVHTRHPIPDTRYPVNKAHGLEPRMSFRLDSELLGNFSFEEVDLRTSRREGREPVRV
jgi:hypothetical protein